MSAVAEASKAPVKAKGKGKAAKATPPAPKANKVPRKAATPLDAYGYREGSKKSLAAAMYASKKGATLEEVKAELGSVQLNLLKDCEKQGFKVERTKENGTGKRQITRYHLSATKAR